MPAIVRLCYRLDQEGLYRRGKRFAYDLLVNPESRMRGYFDVSMIVLVVASVWLLLYAVKDDVGAFGLWFERFAVTVFICEYLLRLWVHSDAHRRVIEHYERSHMVDTPFRLWPALRDVLADKWAYVTTPMAVIDLLAIIPSYRPLRILRLFLLFRLFKLFRYARSVHAFAGVLQEKRFELFTLFGFLAFVLFASAAAIYIFESRHEGGQVDNFAEGIYWAMVTLSTVGFGDITPQTPEGRFVTVVLIICGVGVISFFTSIIVSGFGEKMVEVRDQRVFADLERRGGHTILCGFGRVGQLIAQQLTKDRELFAVVDPDPDNVALAKRLGYLVVQGRAESTELLRNLGVATNARRILCLTADDVANLYATLTARSLNPDIEIVSRANREETDAKLRLAGADHTVLPFKVVGLIAAEYVGEPVAFEAVYGLLTGRESVAIEAVAVGAGAWLENRSLEQVGLRQRRLALFGVITPDERSHGVTLASYALRNSRFHFNPGPEFRLQAGDVLVLFGHPYSIQHFKQSAEG